MKPPPRNRKKSSRVAEVAEPSHGATQPWTRAELKKLLVGLRKQAGPGADGELLDYELLHKDLPTRSVSEITSKVERLKKQVITNTTEMMRKNVRDERKSRKPIEEWTRMASALAGTQEETIISAFYKMMNESSPKPHTVKSGPPPQAGLTPIRPHDHIIPLRPMLSFPGQGKDLNINTIPSFVGTTPLVFQGPAPQLQQPAPVIRVMQQPQQLLLRSPVLSTSQPIRASSISTAGLSRLPPQTVLLPAQQSPGPSTSTTPSLRFVTSPHTVGLDSLSASTSRYSSILPASQQFTSSSSFSPTINKNTQQGVKAPMGSATVDFNNIYCFISGIQKHSRAHLLTPMESAIVLDLLMSLPEELELLDCNKLKRHMIQVHKFLSGRPNSQRTKQMYEDLKQGYHAQIVAPSAEDPNSQNVPEGEDENLQSCEAASHPAQTDNTSGKDEMMVPPLNPFMIPLDLLKRREYELE
ncbi:uncharacterized protein snapc2 [Gouania willdenowi]|uniref:uncharacterized protein snapc2 n=1 Tax=Gouania willdenowi TaxID=441366 RepID=UPI0010561779|nr:snRNA-activating protein complex subunit 2 [Gouania willdenowi]